MQEFRISQFLSIKRILYWRFKLWRSQYYQPEKLKEMQWRLLSSILDHCYKHVPYYKKVFANIGLRRSDFRSLDDLTKIPIINKWTLIENYEEFKADNFHKFRPIAVTTSGSTGTPMQYHVDINSNVLELTSQWRHFSWAGYRLGQPFADIRNKIVNPPFGYKWNWKCRSLDVSTLGIDSNTIGKYADLLQKYKIKFWRGHPSAIHYLCEILKNSGINHVMPDIIVSSAEPVLEYQRKYIEDYTGVPVCDNFGLHEHTMLVCQCPQGGYHIASEYGIVEILKENSEPAKAGEEGRIITTGLHNRAVPLLRYEIGDYAIASDKTCECGRTLPLVESLTGRYLERVFTHDGRAVSQMRFSVKLGKNIRMTQFVQEKIGEVDFYIVPDKNYSAEDNQEMFDDLKRAFGEGMTFRIHIVPDVPYHEPGKYRFVVNKLMSSSNNGKYIPARSE